MMQPELGPALIRLRALSHKVTWLLGTRFPKTIPLTFVVGYPKSGTTWVCQLVADYLMLPFPRYSILPIGCPAVVHGHELVRKSYPRGVYVVRDGRDVMVSAYFHFSRPIPEGDHPPMNRHQRGLFPGMVNKADVRTNLPAFIEGQMRHPHATAHNWARHVESYHDIDHPHFAMLRYEDLLADGPSALAEAMGRITGDEPDRERARTTVEKFSFARQAGRRAGQEDRSSFLRKGQAGDWVNYFSREAAEVFDQYCGQALIASGYEPDRSWVERCP